MQQPEGENARIAQVAMMFSAYAQNNHVSIAEIPTVMASLNAALDTLSSPVLAAPVVEARKEPAVSIKKSVTPDFLIDLFTGKKFKSLKRYLRTSHNMSPEDYRAYWGLPRDYPMTAPNYAAKRSELAKAIGLGRAGGPGRARAAAPAAAEAPKAPKAPRAAKAAAAPKVAKPRAAKAPKAPAAPAEAPKSDAAA
jgi:predicted transcriptional regulator